MLIGILCFNFTSCVDIDLTNISKDVQINESLVVPIGEAELSIGDILDKITLPDGIVTDVDTIKFVTEFNNEYSFRNVDMLENPITTNLPFTVNPIPIVPANTEIPMSGAVTNVDLGLDPNSETRRVDKIVISSFTFGINVTQSNLYVFGTTTPISPSDLKIVMTFPKMYKNGTNTLIDPVEVNITSFGQAANVTITNFYMDTQGLTGTPIQVNLFSGGRNITVGASASFNLSVIISDIQDIVAYGKFQLASSVPTIIKLPLDVLSAIPSGIQFANPKVFLSLRSDIGTYLSFNVESIKAYSMDHSIVKQGYFYGNPSVSEPFGVKAENPGEFVSKQFKTVDKDYGNLDQLLDPELDTLEYKFSVITDDARNNASLTPSFITPGMSVNAKVKIEVPLYFKAGSKYTLTDTIADINIPFGDVESAILKLNVTNGLPLKAKFSMKFLDASNNVITSSLNDLTYTINAGEVNSSGLVTAETVSPIDIELTKAQANEIKDAKGMIYSLELAGKTDNDPIQVTRNNHIKVKIGAFIKAGTTFSLESNN